MRVSLTGRRAGGAEVEELQRLEREHVNGIFWWSRGALWRLPFTL